MRIGVYVGELGPATVGGGSVFQNEVLKELAKQNTVHELFIYYFGTIDHIQAKSNVRLVRLSKLLKLKDCFFSIKDLICIFFRGFRRGYSFMNRIAQNDGIDLMYFPSPSVFVETEVPYIFTMWDLGDKVHPYLPETSMGGREFEFRDFYYRKALPKAMFVFIGNDTGKKQLMNYYHIGEDRIVKNPMITPSYIYSTTPDEGILDKYGLTKCKYLFYPAQFWPHKNHIRVVQAMSSLSKYGYKLVLSGHDYGNLGYIKSKVQEYGLENFVLFAGFITREEIVGLYKNAFALVYASIMGPDNIPPLEAMGLGCPVICAEYDGAREQLKDAALFFNPHDAVKIVDAVKALENDSGLKETLAKRGKELAEAYCIEKYVGTVYDTFRRAAVIRECWDMGAAPRR